MDNRSCISSTFDFQISLFLPQAFNLGRVIDISYDMICQNNTISSIKQNKTKSSLSFILLSLSE